MTVGKFSVLVQGNIVMDVKYIPADWERARSSLKNLIGKGAYGKGMVDELKEINSNFEKAESTISGRELGTVVSGALAR